MDGPRSSYSIHCRTNDAKHTNKSVLTICQRCAVTWQYSILAAKHRDSSYLPADQRKNKCAASALAAFLRSLSCLRANCELPAALTCSSNSYNYTRKPATTKPEFTRFRSQFLFRLRLLFPSCNILTKFKHRQGLISFDQRKNVRAIRSSACLSCIGCYTTLPRPYQPVKLCPAFCARQHDY